MAEDNSTWASRLRWAIQRPSWRTGRQRGLRLFERRLRELAGTRKGRRLRGSSLTSIQTYLRGRAEPSLSFLRGAAKVLGIREAWLLWGDGLPTDAEMEVATAAKGNPLEHIGRMLLRDKLGQQLGRGGFGFWDMPDSTRESVIRGHAIYRALALAEKAQARARDEARLTRTYVNYLAAPFKTLGMDPTLLEPVERALLVEALLRPIEIVKSAVERDRAQAIAKRRLLDDAKLRKNNPIYRWLIAATEGGSRATGRRSRTRHRRPA